MTGPVGDGSVGDAYVDIHANTGPFNDDLERGIGRATPGAEREGDRLGRNVGSHIGDAMERETGRRGPAIGRSIGEAVEREVINIRPNFRYNVRGRNGRFISRAAADIRGEVEEAFAGAAAGSGSLFQRIGTGIADAIGAGFNVSGRSPLIYILAPVYAAIAGLVIAAIQAANGIVAALAAVPAAISVLLVEVGVLYIALQGVGTAIQGAFAAKNAEELAAAIKDLTPSAQSFVKALLPLKGLYDTLKGLLQENFFAAFGGGARITALIDAITKPLKERLPVVAYALGNFFGQLTAFFSSGQFIRFLDDLLPAVAAIVNMLGPASIDLVKGLFTLMQKTLPFLLLLTERFGVLLRLIGEVLADVDSDWLMEMLGTLDKTFTLLGKVIEFLAVLFKQVNAGGGGGLLDFLIGTMNALIGFFGSDVGKSAITGLIRLAELGIFILLGLVAVIGVLAAAFERITTWIAEFAHWVIGLFADDAPPRRGIENFGHAVGEMAEKVGMYIGQAIDFIKGIPGKVTAALGNIGSLLFNAGKNLINGFLNGIKAAVPAVEGFLGWVTDKLTSWKGPEDKDKKLLVPAGRAVMQGFGAGLALGATDIRTMLGDYTDGLGTLGVNSTSNTYVFGANSIRVGFNGALPTMDQATSTGGAVGTGIVNQLAARNTRLAVRTL